MFKTRSITFIELILVFIVFASSVDARRIRPPFCDCEFIREWNPLCGTNGRTYGGPNFLACKNACERTEVQIWYWGPCNGDDRFT
ncbi:serine protease inhibitor Kazal-type 10-like [Nasonia vitripennis]|uniref:Kazal-like domain-containing protein n=1 Tax=Nasonia vitripennis TaxID=7425 RepID=A0A7M7H2W5_NASVI|nr:serine protease inhibitor Kazal-type 10-like [Nasonia vitripennis]